MARGGALPPRPAVFPRTNPLLPPRHRSGVRAVHPAPLTAAPPNSGRSPPLPWRRPERCAAGRNPPPPHEGNFVSPRRLPAGKGRTAPAPRAALHHTSISLQFGCSVIRRHRKAISPESTEKGSWCSEKRCQHKEGEMTDFVWINAEKHPFRASIPTANVNYEHTSLSPGCCVVKPNFFPLTPWD